MSIFNREHNVVFIHVPRTAGTSMEYAPFLGGGGHERIREYDAQDAFKFAFVRNPWDRFVSAFFCQNNVRLEDRDKFNQFVLECSQLNHDILDTRNIESFTVSGVYRVHFAPQWYFLLDVHDKIGVDYVGKFESLQDDWRYVCERLGVEHELEHRRKTGHWPYEGYYTPDSWEIVGRLYSRDIALFGY